MRVEVPLCNSIGCVCLFLHFHQLCRNELHHYSSVCGEGDSGNGGQFLEYLSIHVPKQGGAWPSGLIHKLFAPWGVRPLLKRWVPGSAMWPSKNGSILAVYIIKRMTGVLGAMRCNEQIRMQHSRASGSINLLSYGRFCGLPLLVPQGVLHLTIRTKRVTTSGVEMALVGISIAGSSQWRF